MGSGPANRTFRTESVTSPRHRTDSLRWLMTGESMERPRQIVRDRVASQEGSGHEHAR